MKKRYLITYDLNSTGQKYDKVIQSIKDCSDGVWCTYWKSSFLIRSNFLTADEVMRRIQPYIDSNDSIIVMEVTKNYQGFLTTAQWDYINNRVFSDF